MAAFSFDERILSFSDQVNDYLVIGHEGGIQYTSECSPLSSAGEFYQSTRISK